MLRQKIADPQVTEELQKLEKLDMFYVSKPVGLGLYGLRNTQIVFSRLPEYVSKEESQQSSEEAVLSYLGVLGQVIDQNRKLSHFSELPVHSYFITILLVPELNFSPFFSKNVTDTFKEFNDRAEQNKDYVTPCGTVLMCRKRSLLSPILRITQQVLRDYMALSILELPEQELVYSFPKILEEVVKLRDIKVRQQS